MWQWLPIIQKHGSGFLQLHTAGWCSGVPKQSASVTLVQPCIKNSLHSHISKIQSTDPPRLRRWTCVNINTFRPSAYRISITVLCSSLVQTESVADMFHSWQQLTQWQQGYDYQCTDMSHNQLQCSQLSVFPHPSTQKKKKTAITSWRSSVLHKFWGFCSVVCDNSVLLRYNEEVFKQTEQCSEVHIYH
jgi:hypothetical protein